MSDEVTRIHGWPVGVPIKMRGGGEGYVVCERESPDSLVLSGYYINVSGDVVPLAWTSSGRKYIDGCSGSDLDPSYRKIPESELPLWTIEDSKALLGKMLLRINSPSATFVACIRTDDNALFLNGSVAYTYNEVAKNYTHLDGTEIPKRRMP